MTRLRIWHASRDAYHTSFRLIRLLDCAPEKSLSMEWLRICDMYVLFPELLHKTSLPGELKENFRALRLRRPEDLFIHLPSASTIFQNIRIYQNFALTQLAAKSVVVKDDLALGTARMKTSRLPEQMLARIRAKNEEQANLIALILQMAKELPLGGAEGIYRRARLPARGVSA